jgi:hypothetical protein
MSPTTKQQAGIEITGTQDLEPSDRAALKFLHRLGGKSGKVLDPAAVSIVLLPDSEHEHLPELRKSLDRLMAVKVNLKSASLR